MIYPPAPDIWLLEVLFRQSQAASALREEARVGTWSWRDQGQPSLADLVEAGCRCGLPSISTPLRCTF